MANETPRRKRPDHPMPSNTGNPRINVAFPFSRITVSAPDAALAAVADVLYRLLVHLASAAHESDPDRAPALDELADQAAAIMERFDLSGDRAPRG